MKLKTKLVPIAWVNVRGRGKLKMKKEDNGDPDNYNYTATAILDKDTAEEYIKIFNKFWRENKPDGVGKQKYDLVKPETRYVLDSDNNVVKDEDDEPLREPTGRYILQAKTLTQWPDGKPVEVKLLGSNGKPLPEGHCLEAGCGEGTMGIIHGSLGVNAYDGNEGLMFYLSGVQIKESTFTPYEANDIEAEYIEDDDLGEPDEEDSDDMPEV